MDPTTYAVESEVEQTHWWFVVRRRLIARLIEQMGVPTDAPVLDLGTSTGTNLRLLRELGFCNYQGVDLSEDAIRWCAEKGLGTVTKGDVCNLPFDDGLFRLVLATDIVEHVEDDVRAMSEIARVLEPDGRAVITVPAFQMLWGLQDEVAHHKRRYREGELRRLIARSGLKCIEGFYFNYLLFLPILVARQIIRIMGIKLKSEGEVNTPLLNRLLGAVFSIDVRTAQWLKPPFGVSYLAVVKRA